MDACMDGCWVSGQIYEKDGKMDKQEDRKMGRQVDKQMNK